MGVRSQGLKSFVGSGGWTLRARGRHGGPAGLRWPEVAVTVSRAVNKDGGT
ncbi:MAG TPA: hypothetical protein VE645_18135 [Pseudonocardiaceae bacterium]|nr:hypothetical protein [Pseudonocardiaceae bacterium]